MAVATATAALWQIKGAVQQLLQHKKYERTTAREGFVDVAKVLFFRLVYPLSKKARAE